jgi:hypothetical protein
MQERTLNLWPPFDEHDAIAEYASETAERLEKVGAIGAIGGTNENCNGATLWVTWDGRKRTVAQHVERILDDFTAKLEAQSIPYDE